MLNLDEEKFRIPLLDGKNYNNWKFRIQVLLNEHNLLDCIEDRNDDDYEIAEDGTRKEKLTIERKLAEIIKGEKKCKLILISKIADSHLEIIKEKETPSQIWKTFEGVFERKSMTKFY